MHPRHRALLEMQKLLIDVLMHKRKTRRTKWVHELLLNREEQGDYHHLVQELYNDPLRFKTYFRLTPELFELLHEKVATRITKTETNMRKPIISKERLSICLRFLATGDSFVSIAFSYRVGTLVDEVTKVIWDVLVNEYMPVPATQDWVEIAKEFQERWNFPNCIGAIDGKHVVLQAPPNSGSLYLNYKGTHSIVLLALVDAHYPFRVIDVGAFGRNSDGGVFSRARPIWLKGSPEFGVDSAFSLQKHLMRPFPGQQLTTEKRVYNYRLSRARRVVENAFGILSNQWRVYRRVMAVTPEKAEAIVKTTCILHNFLRIHGNKCEEEHAVRSSPCDSQDSLQPVLRMGANSSSRLAVSFREKFCTYSSPQGEVSWQHSIE
uniref:DDE Tnp4 domain-containing protein n=1 Tax=Sinocyclocheilus anshuiensis TaxID=1608454 RepID=A0A671R801_9TELE